MHVQVQQEYLNERRRLEDQLSSLQHRLAAEHSRSTSSIDALRQQHASDQASLTDQLTGVQQQTRVETARLNGRLESALAEVRPCPVHPAFCPALFYSQLCTR